MNRNPKSKSSGDNFRRRLLTYARSQPPIVYMLLLTVLAGACMWGLQALGRCPKGEPPPMAFQLTFSAPAFRALLNETGCATTLFSLKSILLDSVFTIVYAMLLIALLLWAERWKHLEAPDENGTRPRDDAPSSRFRFVMLLPPLAALLDAFPENLSLYTAAHSPADVAGIQTLVSLGSFAAAFKWALLGAFVLFLIRAALSGPRGIVLWRVRYSLFAVLLGAGPLLVIPQGQEILQRLVEGERPATRVVLGVLVLSLVAVVNWICARTLTQVRTGTVVISRSDATWFAFFERNIPRMLGVATLVLVALAFARSAEDGGWFVGLAGGSYALGMVIMERARRFLGLGVTWFLLRLMSVVRKICEWIGLIGAGTVNSKAWNSDKLLPDRLGRALLGSLAAIGFLFLHGISDQQSHEAFFLRLGAALLLFMGWWLFILLYFRRELIPVLRGDEFDLKALREEEQDALAAGFPEGPLPRRIWIGFGLGAAASALAFVIVNLRAVPVARFLGPLNVLGITVANAVFMGSVAAFVGRKYRIPVVPMALAFAAIVSNWNDNHAIRRLSATNPPQEHARLAIAARLEQWLAQQAKSGPVQLNHTQTDAPIPLYLVAASGGGLRAAYWTASSLARLQDEDSTFASHIFAISGVSGGSVGATVFAALMHDQSRTNMSDTPPHVRNCGQQLPKVSPLDTLAVATLAMSPTSMTACAKLFMSDDFLAPVLAKFVTADFTQWFVPFPSPVSDRAEALEESWEQSYQAVTGTMTMGNSYDALMDSIEVKNGVPALLLNTTHVESGRRYITAPFTDPDVFADAPYVHIALDNQPMRLSTAAHNSARFSYVSPAGRIERGNGNSYGSLVDGGYFENSGLATLNELRVAVDSLLMDTLVTDSMNAQQRAVQYFKRRVRISTIYLCNDPVSCRRERNGTLDLKSKRASAGEWFAPLRALLATRGARGSLAQRQAVRQTGQGQFFQLNVCDSLRTTERTPMAATDSGPPGLRQTTRERIVNPPLGWMLSAQARRWMDASLPNTNARVLSKDSLRQVVLPQASACVIGNIVAFNSLIARLREPARENKQ